MNLEQMAMKDLQAHAKKIRSDAAECLTLGNLVTEERRHLFQRIAEHLNSLALEIETEARTNVVDASPAAVDREVDPTSHAKVDQRPPARSWHKFTMSLLVVLAVIAGAVFWVMPRTEMQLFSFANGLPKTDAPSRNIDAELATLLSDDRGQRKAFGDQLQALIVRLDGLTKRFDDLQSIHAESVTSSSKAGLAQEAASATAEPKLPDAEENPARAGNGGTPLAPAASEQTASPAATTANPASDQSDQVATISPSRIDLDPHKPTVGPVGCMHFRSFDPVSGTYTTFDGRRRQCR
jgi:BA14K-like protein